MRHQLRRTVVILSILFISPLILIAHSSDDTKTMTKQMQKEITPEIALKMLKKGNKRFLEGKMTHRDYLKQVAATGEGQYPYASIVACLDSRTTPEFLFDQGIGDLFVARVAGNFVNADILGSLEFASKVAGSKLIVVLGHTSCGAVKGACDNVQLGNIASIVNTIKPSVEAVTDVSGERSSKNHHYVERVADENIKRTMQDILTKSSILKEMIDKGELKLVGAKLDIKTGAIMWL